MFKLNFDEKKRASWSFETRFNPDFFKTSRASVEKNWDFADLSIFDADLSIFDLSIFDAELIN